MPGAHEKLERAEHAAHADGHHGPSNKLFGVTMALIGVLIAFCAAMVGSERNELTRTMIEQTQAHSNFTGASTKFRLIMIELEKQRARIAAARDPQGGWSPVERFIELAGDYSEERNLAKNWADSYHPLVEAHFDAAEGYERAQLIAEIGIVLASLGVLLGSRPAWVISVILALVSVVQLGRTYLPTRQVVREAIVRVHHTEEAFDALRKGHAGANEDGKQSSGSIPTGSSAPPSKSGPGCISRQCRGAKRKNKSQIEAPSTKHQAAEKHQSTKHQDPEKHQGTNHQRAGIGLTPR